MRCGATRTSCRSRCAAPHARRPSAPDGRRLYTLYTRDATATEPAESFVHVLDLERERATCIDLPAEFASSPVGAVAVSPSGTRLYVVAPAAGALAEIDTAALRITRTAQLPGAVDRDDGAGNRRREHDALRRHGRRGDVGGPHRSHRVRRVVRARAPSPASSRRRARARSSSRSPTGCSRSTRRRARPSASSLRSMPARSTTSRPRCARSSRRTAPTSSAPAER